MCAAFLRELLARGLRVEAGLPCVIDGAKGLRKAIQMVFGPQALMQRCQWHKHENVVRYVPLAQQAMWRRRLQQAYEPPTYAEARTALARPVTGCAADGPTYKDALANVEVVIQEWIETATENGRLIPKPKGRLVFA